MLKHISQREWKFFGVFSAILTAILALPFLYAYFSTPPNLYFSGLHMLAPGDYSVYFSYITQAQNGHFLFRDLFTTESTSYNIINTFWVFAGIVGNFFSLSPQWAFQAARLISIPFLVFTLYIFFSYFYQSEKHRKFILIFACFASGLGVYFLPFFPMVRQIQTDRVMLPPDIWVSESNIFLSMLHSGHMVFSLALTVIIFFLSILFAEKKNYLLSACSGVVALALFSFHPFQAPVIFGVQIFFALYESIKNKKIEISYITHIFLTFLISSPMIAYYIFMLQFDPITQERAVQNINLSPPLYSMFMGFGFLGVFALAGTIFCNKTPMRDKRRDFLVVWIVVQLMLMYAPLNYQRRLIEGFSVPLIILSFDFIIFVYDKLKIIIRSNTWRFLLLNTLNAIIIFILIFLPSNIFVYSADFLRYIKKDSYIYFPKKDIEPLLWLSHKNNEGAVLAEINTSHFIPAIAGKQVFAGHMIETVHFSEKLKEVNDFFRDNSNDNEKIEFLKKNNIRYVYYGPKEKALGNFKPEEKIYLKKIFINTAVIIYEFSQ